MNPIDPPNDAPFPAADHEKPAITGLFWDYKDLVLFFFLLIPSLGVAFLATALVTTFTTLSAPFKLFLLQVVFYALAFGSLGALFHLRYQQPFWRSLGWKPLPFSRSAASFLAGPLLALSLGIFGLAIRT